jgi:6-hydroxynicotinate 3-monooxygenase
MGENMSSQPRIAVIGAGLGGTTATILLQRAGYRVKVYEQAPALGRIGAGINLSPNVTRVLRHIGILDALSEIGCLPRERLRREWDTGRITYAFPVEKFPELYGAPHLIVHRGDLQEALTGALQSGALELGKRLTEVEETDSGATLSFADGSTAEADIVIGADGINSRLREILLGPEPPIYTGEVAYRGIFPRALIGDLHVPDHTKWTAPDGTHILIYCMTKARDEIYFVTGVQEPEWGADNYNPQTADLERMRSYFSGFHAEVRRVLAACPAATRWPILEREPLPLWSRGRIVLLGDACHPMRPHMGQGAAMAIEDASMLIRCIEHEGGNNPEAIFNLYRAQRVERTSKVQSISQGNDWMRTGGDASWLLGYDVINVPLVMPQDAAAPTAAAK